MSRSETHFARRIGLLPLLCGFMLAIGCSSIKSELYSTDGCCEEKTTKHLHGVPITVDVPTHVRIDIVETKYFELKTVPPSAAPVNGLPSSPISIVNPVVAPDTAPQKRYVLRTDLKPSRQVKYDLVMMKDLYTVDLKRPASGKIEYTLGFNDGANGTKRQYFNQIKTKTTDRTIQDVAGLIQTVISTAPTLASLNKVKLTALETGTAGDNDLIQVSGTIASEFFNINDPQLSDKIHIYLEAYLNQCTPQCPRPMLEYGTVMGDYCPNGNCRR